MNGVFKCKYVRYDIETYRSAPPELRGACQHALVTVIRHTLEVFLAGGRGLAKAKPRIALVPIIGHVARSNERMSESAFLIGSAILNMARAERVRRSRRVTVTTLPARDGQAAPNSCESAPKWDHRPNAS